MVLQSFLPHVWNTVVIASITLDDLAHTGLVCEKYMVDFLGFVCCPRGFDVKHQHVNIHHVTSILQLKLETLQCAEEAKVEYIGVWRVGRLFFEFKAPHVLILEAAINFHSPHQNMKSRCHVEEEQ